VQQQRVQQQQQQQQVHVQLHPQPQPVPQFNLKLQPPPPAGVSNPQDSGAGFPASTVGGGGRCSGSGGGGCDSGRCPHSASVDKLVIAAADSLGALSAGGGSRRSASTPGRSQGPQRSEEDAAQAVRQVRGSPQGIPTDEELDMLHEHLANIPQQVNFHLCSAARNLRAPERSTANTYVQWPFLTVRCSLSVAAAGQQ
jgi:hypothetical protein